MKLLGAEAIAGGVEKHWLHTGDDGKDRITVETIVDVEPILKRNAAEMASASSSYNGDMHKVASIPCIVIDQMCALHNISLGELMATKTDKAKSIMNELLNSRDFRAFRTKPGVVKV